MTTSTSMPHSSCDTAYMVSAPINIFARTYDRDQVLANLRRCGIARILLCGATLSNDAAVRQKLYDKLPGEVAFYKSNGLEVWFWRWAFWLEGEHPFTHAVSYRGESRFEVCPLDPGFQELACDNLKRIAASGVDGILYDDDFRFDNGNIGLGCLCPRHLQRAEELLGHAISTDDIEKRVFLGKPNPERTALLKVWGESLKEFARISRKAVDAVNPNVRFGFCACMSGYDGDGTTVMELAPILAGNTRPYVRLIGAPYWATFWIKWEGFFIRILEIVEYERWQASLLPPDFEVFSEGDVYPRPRFQIPASHLELLDSAIRFDGHVNGIQKYMFDYTSSAGYETGYMEQHLDNQDYYDGLPVMLAGTVGAGIRVWQEPRLIENADFSDIPKMPVYVDRPLYYPQAAFALAAHGIPAVHCGNGMATICFGESARTLPEEFRQRPLILDIAAAKLLHERGWDIGLLAIGERFKPAQECFPDGETIQLLNSYPGSRHIRICLSATPLSHFDNPEEIASFRYHSPDGANILVFNFEGTVSDESSWRNYRFPTTILDFLQLCGVVLPAALTSPVPDLYIQCRTDDTSCVIGLWNAHADRVKTATIQLGKNYSTAEWLNGSGTLNGNILTLQNLPAFSFATVKLTAASNALA